MSPPRRQCVAREREPSHATATPAEAAVAKIREGLAELADADLSLCSDDELAAAALAQRG